MEQRHVVLSLKIYQKAYSKFCSVLARHTFVFIKIAWITFNIHPFWKITNYDLIASGPISESFQSHSRYGRAKISGRFEIRLVNEDCPNGMENYKWYYRNSILLNMAVSCR